MAALLVVIVIGNVKSDHDIFCVTSKSMLPLFDLILITRITIGLNIEVYACPTVIFVMKVYNNLLAITVTQKWGPPQFLAACEHRKMFPVHTVVC